MAKYLWKVSYSSDGLKGLAKEGGTKRRAAVDRLTEGLGGKVESFYRAPSEPTGYAISPIMGSGVWLTTRTKLAGLVRVCLGSTSVELGWPAICSE
jgi:hypothetical protein